MYGLSDKNQEAIRYALVGCVKQVMQYGKFILRKTTNICKPPHEKKNKMVCAPSDDSDQPGHPPSLISLRCALNV